MNDNMFRIIAGLMLLCAVVISVYHRHKADRDAGEKVSWKDEGIITILALRIGGLVLWLSTIGYLIYPPLLAWSRISLPEEIRWLGVGIGIIGIVLTYWLFSSIGTGISPTVDTRKNHKLATSGPYRWIRHPLYTVGTMNFIATALITDTWFIAVLALIAFMLLAKRTPNEEAHLIAKFGEEYLAYMKRTGRFFPRLKMN